MPVSTAPYKRTYLHTKKRGKESTITCGFCGRKTPRWKAFTVTKGFRITDPTILKQVDKRMLHLMRGKIKVCPSCARFHGVVKVGKSVRKKHM